MDPLSPFEPLTFGLLQLELEALEPTPLEGFIGPTLRGMLGHAMHAASCTGEGRPAFATGSLYHEVFEAPPPLPGEQDTPPPFVLHAPPEPGTKLRPGDRLDFALTLFGPAVMRTPALLWAVFRYGLREGLSRVRRRFLLRRVLVQTPAGMLEVFRGDTGPCLETWDPDWTWSGAGWLRRRLAQTVPAPTRLAVDLVTPLELRENRAPVEAVAFHHLLRSALRAAYAHTRFNCGASLEIDHSGLAALARNIPRGRDATHTLELQRESSRQGKRIDVPGRQGRLEFYGALELFVPVLTLGEVLHLGKQRTMGMGGVRLEWRG
jgi:hypothetical protein